MRRRRDAVPFKGALYEKDLPMKISAAGYGRGYVGRCWEGLNERKDNTTGRGLQGQHNIQ